MIGFDYGTSNCAVAFMQQDKPQHINLGQHGRYMPSTLYAPSRDIISLDLMQKLPTAKHQGFKSARQLQLSKGSAAMRELREDDIPTHLSFGQLALDRYLEDPEEGYYIKSPKSFLGASGLLPPQIALFEDIVASMMLEVKTNTEQQLGREITQTVIGRPINFQGLDAQKSNQQAIEILTNAAKRIGFKDVEFQFEPVAAGFEFESTLTKETKVLVVDIGGGTSDISMLLMGPQYSVLDNRTQQLLAHSGQRIGGNDLDIQLCMRGLMPALGLGSLATTGKPLPTSFHWQAASINNINDQTEFYSDSNGRALAQLKKEAAEPQLIERLIKVQQEKLSYQLVNSAERAKVSLTDNGNIAVPLNYLADELTSPVSLDTLYQANTRHLDNIGKLIDNTIEQANCQPDVVFVTGGSAQSPVLRNFLTNYFKDADIELVTGDHFGSVTAGLARWAGKVFK
ncbi:molecular chaperone [Psychrobium sp. MM17-31]|uniref:molecular chaperone n=1 Tax=Psychrobium sp. MM17-31 TaxID=2917758 RepID=UPI001EF5FC37|nr:molecular chaperone [Psychrobium sp. MM17-31]MCG7531170.1 molecular chaperone [Psychrobium sp. MM17-31]